MERSKEFYKKIELLILHGADPYVSNSKGYDTFQYIEMEGISKTFILNELMDRGLKELLESVSIGEATKSARK